MLEQTQKRADALKAELTEMLVAYGNPDEKGNIWIDLGDLELKRERRVSKSFNSSAAEAWAKENGYWDTVKEVVEVLSEDKLLGLAWNSEDIQEKVKTFYVEKETWALKA
jgi:Cu2+-containing amine oxidase